jgi:hypothetical protein
VVERLRRFVTALQATEARTSPKAEDPRLKGRTYAVPFERVWQAALRLADGGLRGWVLVSADDQAGVINAEAANVLLRRTDDVEVRVQLDADAQTRVDARSTSRVEKADLGANARRLVKFFESLDRAVGLAG